MTPSRRDLLAGFAAAVAPTSGRAAEPGVPPPDSEHWVTVPGGRIYVRVNGDLQSGRTPLLLTHGGPGGALWQFFPALPLAQDRAVVLYDQLDSGRSDAPGDARNWTVDRFVGEIGAIRTALRLDRVHLLGHSWGGILANRYAAARPAGLRSVILQGAPLSAKSAAASVQSLVEALPAEARDALRRGARPEAPDDPSYTAAVRLFMTRHLARTSVRDVALPYMAPTPEDRGDALAAAMTGGDILRGFTGVLAGFDDEALLERIAAPTLLMCGSLDIMTPAATRAYLPRLRNGAFVEIPEAGHMIQFDQPEAWRRAVAGFVARHET